MRKSIHAKKNINDNINVTVYKAPEKPMYYSVKTSIIRIIIVNLICAIGFTGFIQYNNSKLNSIIAEKDMEIYSLRVENYFNKQENLKLSDKIDEKDSIISTKTAEIEAKLNNLDEFKKYLMSYVGLSQGGSTQVVSRSLSTGRQMIKDSLDLTNIDDINNKLVDFETKLDSDVVEFGKLLIEVEDRIDYIDSFPDFFPTTGKITSKYGYRTDPVTYVWGLHRGIDIANSYDTQIFSAGKGKVISTNYSYDYGNYIVIDHGYGFTTKYAHLSKIKVNVGDSVAKGDLIGYMGSTGESTGSHLHFEIRTYGKLIDPLTIKNYFK